MRFAFSGTVDDHEAAQPLDHGIVGTHWLSQADLQEREQRLRSPLVLRCIEDYLAGEQRPLQAWPARSAQRRRRRSHRAAVGACGAAATLLR